MTGHTKEPWVLRLNAGDETRIQADSGAGVSLAVCDIKCGGLASRTVAEAEQMASDIVARYNALATIPDPLAFVQAARGMAEALEETWGEPGETGRAAFLATKQKARDALTAFHAALSERKA